MKVTFDTNVLDLACRPERFPRDHRQPNLARVHDALAAGLVQGFYSVTMLTIEGVMKQDRASVYGGTRIVIGSETVTQDSSGDENIERISVEFRVEQPGRKPFHPEVIARVQAAHRLGLRALKAPPRIGAFHIDDQDEQFYLGTGADDDLKAWTTRVHRAVREIESRGVGIAQVKALGFGLAGKQTPWFKALESASDVHERRKIERAFGEWADGDAVASHIAYGLDVFCSDDVGKSNATNSILDPINRRWLADEYGVKFMTFDDLLAELM